jgi:hypothetical protein
LLLLSPIHLHIMKKLFLTVIIAAGATFAAQAQDISFGVKGGLNVASMTDVDASSKISGHIGGFANFKFQKSWAIQPELLFSGQGARVDLPGDDLKYALSYINIPVLFQYYFLPEFYAEAGPQLGILASSRVKRGGVSEDVDGFKSVDIGSAIGVGYKFPINVGVYARYTFGFTDLIDGLADPRNSVFQIGASYTFK